MPGDLKKGLPRWASSASTPARQPSSPRHSWLPPPLEHARGPDQAEQIPLTRNEIAHLLTTTRSAPDASHWIRWSRWRRRHQYRCRNGHYQRQVRERFSYAPRRGEGLAVADPCLEPDGHDADRGCGLVVRVGDAEDLVSRGNHGVTGADLVDYGAERDGEMAGKDDEQLLVVK